MSRFERDWRIRWTIAFLLVGGLASVIWSLWSAVAAPLAAWAMGW